MSDLARKPVTHAERDDGAVGPADFGPRFSAFMIDAALLFAIQWIVVLVGTRQLESAGLSSVAPCDAEDPLVLCEKLSPAVSALVVLYLLITTVGYYGYFEGRYGQTPGKRLLGLRVVGDDGADPIGWTRALQRSIVRQAFWLSLFFVLDGSPLHIPLPSLLVIGIPLLAAGPVIQAAFAWDGRGWHDQLASTVVVSAQRDGEAR